MAYRAFKIKSPEILINERNQNSRHKIQKQKKTIIVVSDSVIDADIFGVEILGYLDVTIIK